MCLVAGTVDVWVTVKASLTAVVGGIYLNDTIAAVDIVH